MIEFVSLCIERELIWVDRVLQQTDHLTASLDRLKQSAIEIHYSARSSKQLYSEAGEKAW
jgi:hypothetical protein